MRDPKGMMIAALAAGVLLCGANARAQDKQPGAEKIEQWVIENTRAGAQAEFFVVLQHQANLAAASQVKGKLAKGELVYRTLLATAQETQKPIIAELEARGVEYQSFYLVNAILVKGDRSLARMLAARPDVRRIDGNPVMRQELPKPHAPEPLEFNPDWSVITAPAILAA
ncbi:MAG: hypothetical protein ACLGI9_08180, partial [Thermoanaerobaculia bacterium]